MFKYSPITYIAVIIVSRTIEVAMLKHGMLTIVVFSDFRIIVKYLELMRLMSDIDILCTIIRLVCVEMSELDY